MLNPTLLLACVVLAASFAFLAIVSWRKCAACLREMRESVSSIRSARGKIEAHDSELDAITDSIHQLRGKFYAERRKLQQTSGNSDSQEGVTDAAIVDVASLKAHLRRKAGLVAGKPAPHA